MLKKIQNDNLGGVHSDKSATFRKEISLFKDLYASHYHERYAFIQDQINKSGKIGCFY